MVILDLLFENNDYNLGGDKFTVSCLLSKKNIIKQYFFIMTSLSMV